MAVRTREPTGEVPFPMIMVEGGEKAGKSYTALSLSASPRVGRTFVFALGERTVDGYKRLGRYEVVQHNGTYSDIFGQIREATAEPTEDDKPNVIVIDSGSMLWELHKDFADNSARSTAAARKKLEEDPDAEIDTSMPHWNKAKDRWWAIFNHLRSWPGIVVVTARASEVAMVRNGRPVPNQTEWSVQIEKGTPFAMTAIVRVDHPNPPVLRAVESLDVSIPSGGLVLPAESTLDHLIFDLMGASRTFSNGELINPSVGQPTAQVKIALLDRAKAAMAKMDGRGTPQQIHDAAVLLCGRIWEESGLGKVEEVPIADAQRLQEALDEALESLRVNTTGPGDAQEPDPGPQEPPQPSPDTAPAPPAQQRRSAPPAAAQAG